MICFLLRIFIAKRLPVYMAVPSSFKFSFSTTYTYPKDPCPSLAPILKCSGPTESSSHPSKALSSSSVRFLSSSSPSFQSLLPILSPLLPSLKRGPWLAILLNYSVGLQYLLSIAFRYDLSILSACLHFCTMPLISLLSLFDHCALGHLQRLFYHIEG
jgi:hypothetical protein